MKRSFNILFLALLFLMFCADTNCIAQSPSWAWAKNATTYGGSIVVQGMGSDATGNTYILGQTFAGIQFGNLPSLPAGMFLVKHDPQGNPVWAFQANCRPYAFASDSAGNSYVTGSFRGQLTLGNNVLVCQGKQDIFVAKFNSAGNVIWANRAGGIGESPLMPPTPIIDEDEAYSLGVDGTGNCYIGGIVIASDTSSAMFNSIAVLPPNSTLSPTRFNILAKYNAGGQIQWVRTINSQHLLSRTITVSKKGQCFAAGVFGGTFNYGGTTLTSQGQEDISLAAYDTNGNLSWVKRFGGSGSDFVDALAVDKQGNLIITGSFQNTVHFGNYTLVKPGSSGTIFITKLDKAGNVLWASQATGAGSAGDSKITLDTAGNSYLNSAFSNTVMIGSQTFTSSGAFPDILISKWNAAGTPVWAVVAQGLGNDYAGGIALDPVSSECYIAGTFDQNLDFGNYSLQTGTNTNFFLAKLSNLVSAVPEPLKTKTACMVYPNPAAHSFTVKLGKAAGLIGKFQLYNSKGQRVRAVKISNVTEFVIDRLDLPAGLYMYKIESGNKQNGAGKIVLQ